MTIFKLVIRRSLMSVVTLLLVSLIIFWMLEVLPGDVASRILGRDATPESLDSLRTELGLDRPAPVRYLAWLGGLVTGDLGQSLVSSRPVSVILGPRIFNTVLLSAYAFLIYLPLTIIPALLQALNRDRPIDHALSVVTLVLLSLPDFLLATILLLAFVVMIPLLPAISLVDDTSSGLGVFPGDDAAGADAGDRHGRLCGADAARQSDRGARFRLYPHGRAERPVARSACFCATRCPMRWCRHSMSRRSTSPISSVASWWSRKCSRYPGFGSLLVDSLQLRDLPVIEATVMIAAFVYVAANLSPMWRRSSSIRDCGPADDERRDANACRRRQAVGPASCRSGDRRR